MLGVLLLLAVVAAGAGAAFWWWRDQQITEFARTPAGTAGTREVTIPPGSGPRRVADLLAQAGVVGDAELTYAWLRREKLGPKLRAGEYEFTLPLTPEQAIQKVIAGQQKTYHLTIPEGLRLDEILPLLASSQLKLRLDRLEALAAEPAFVKKLGVPATRLEGFLFPDTYSFTHGYTEESVLGKMVSRTLEELQAVMASKDPAVKLDPLQTVTLASIVEKETGAPDERPRIACLFLNRLRLGMPLQTDPTVLYAMMMIRGKFVKNITKQDLVTPHPYNTYTVRGLPPGPIASPGSAALQAVAHPATCSDLYFVSRNDGTHVFCPTLVCHNAAVKKWQVDYWTEQRRRGRPGR
ncbi:MAG TPA: endolytic transglycosylase MltG [Myxococcaceae bacterium]|nr:endolytic transglycosylase MltG [Myxococcaceae bacterium]